jgi:hypothetical protein
VQQVFDNDGDCCAKHPREEAQQQHRVGNSQV